MESNTTSAARDVIVVDVNSQLDQSIAAEVSSVVSHRTLEMRDLIYDEAELSSQQLRDAMSRAIEQSLQAQKVAAVIETLAKISMNTGEYVRLKPEFYFCPVLIGSDSKPVPLYEFIEAVDGLIDYEQIREELPSLSYAQIHGAISFLRKLAQFNTTGKDIDELEDEELAQDEEFIEELKRALADQEITRVLSPSERDV